MRYELIHDSLAKLVYNKASAEQRLRRKIEREIREALQANKDRGTWPAKQDLDYYEPFLAKVNLTEEQQKFLDTSKRRLIKKKRVKLGMWVVAAILIACGGYEMHDQQRQQQQEALERSQDSVRQVQREIALITNRDSLAMAYSLVQIALQEKSEAFINLKRTIDLSGEAQDSQVAILVEENDSLRISQRELLRSREAASVTLDAAQVAFQRASAANDSLQKIVDALRMRPSRTGVPRSTEWRYYEKELKSKPRYSQYTINWEPTRIRFQVGDVLERRDGKLRYIHDLNGLGVTFSTDTNTISGNWAFQSDSATLTQVDNGYHIEFKDEGVILRLNQPSTYTIRNQDEVLTQLKNNPEFNPRWGVITNVITTEEGTIISSKEGSIELIANAPMLPGQTNIANKKLQFEPGKGDGIDFKIIAKPMMPFYAVRWLASPYEGAVNR